MIETSDISKTTKETLTETIDGDLSGIVTDDLIDDIIELPIVKNRIEDFLKNNVSNPENATGFLDAYRMGLKLGLYCGFLSIKELVTTEVKDLENKPVEKIDE